MLSQGCRLGVCGLDAAERRRSAGVRHVVHSCPRSDLSGCGRGPPSTAAPFPRKQPAIDLLYITDRALETDPEGTLPYDAGVRGRLRSVSPLSRWGRIYLDRVGTTSRLGQRTSRVNLTLGPVTELGRFPRTPYRVSSNGPGHTVRPGSAGQACTGKRDFKRTRSSGAWTRRRARRSFSTCTALTRRLRSAAFTLAELCHFLGREQGCSCSGGPQASVAGCSLRAVMTGNPANLAASISRR